MSGHDQMFQKNVIDFKRQFSCVELKFRMLACKLNNSKYTLVIDLNTLP